MATTEKAATRLDEVVQRSHERTDELLERGRGLIERTLDALREQGSLDDAFEPREWHQPDEDESG